MNTSKALFLRDGFDSKFICCELFIGLLPALAWSVYQNGIRGVLLPLASMLMALAADIAYQYIISMLVPGQTKPMLDVMPIMYGLLIVLAMPPRIAIWVLILADVAAVAVYRLLSGIASPVALGGSLALLLTADFTHFSGVQDTSVLNSLLAGETPNISTSDFFFGRMSGGLGDVSGALLILGGIYLIARRHIAWELPTATLVTVGIIASIATPSSIAYSTFIMGQIFCGSTVFAAIFVAADPAHLPITTLGKLICGVFVGTLTMLTRLYLGFNGIFPAVLLMSLLAPLLDRLIRPVMFGGAPKKYDRDLLKKL